MEYLSKPFKFGKFQMTKILDNFGVKKIELKYFSSNKNGGLNFKKYQRMFIKLEDWKNLKKEIKKKK